MIVKFLGTDCLIKTMKYNRTNHTCIQLYDMENGSPFATATVNLPGIRLPHDHAVFIKDYSENDGMANSLIEAGVIFKDVIAIAGSGYCIYNAYSLTPEFIKEYL